ncbi:MAG: hypothetical protein J7L34_01015, partial [Thermotogaceae bacterium]|nr:hypothetical protein [Thermotogaceae bacterium]
MNRSLILTFVFLITTYLLSQAVYIFEDATLYWKDVNEDIILPNNVNVVYSQSGQWWIEDNRPNWQEIIKKVRLVKIDDIPNEPLQFLNSSPIIFKGNSGKYYTYLPEGKGWYEFTWDGKINRILHVSESTKMLFACSGYWKALYTFRDERELGMSVNLQSSCINEGDVYLISGRLYNSPQEAGTRQVSPSKAVTSLPISPDVSQFYERYVFHIGNMEGLLHGAGAGVFDTIINEIEKKYELSFSIVNSTPYQEAQYVIYIKNDPYNGLGFYVPDGEVIIFKDTEDGNVPVGNFKLQGSSKGDCVKIIENKTKDVMGKIAVLQSKRISKDSYERTLEIKLKNLKDDNVNARVVLYGRDI